MREELSLSVFAFQGNLSPLASSSIFQLCVLPILLYGVENWIISPESLQQLESFQGEVAKRILKLPRWYSNTAACLALDWKSLHSVCCPEIEISPSGDDQRRKYLLPSLLSNGG